MFNPDKLLFKYDDFLKFSPKSLQIHYEKHHLVYINNLNKLVEEYKITITNLEYMIKYYFQKNDPISISIFNNAAQHFNHDFFWKSLSPIQTNPSLKLEELIKSSFNSMEEFKSKFKSICLKSFGSSWVWLVYNKLIESFEILSYSNANTPIIYDYIVPILACDIWEHAYYVDFLNNKGEYIDCVLDYFNWKFASENLEKI